MFLSLDRIFLNLFVVLYYKFVGFNLYVYILLSIINCSDFKIFLLREYVYILVDIFIFFYIFII